MDGEWQRMVSWCVLLPREAITEVSKRPLATQNIGVGRCLCVCTAQAGEQVHQTTLLQGVDTEAPVLSPKVVEALLGTRLRGREFGKGPLVS